MLTRLAPLEENANEQREELKRMLQYIDPCIVLQGNVSDSSVADMAKWYKETFGVPGTPEFEANIARINKEMRKDA